MKIAIHQPNLCAWLPFFKKMEAVDLFVVLGHCQFARDYFQHRFKYQSEWFTLSVSRPKHFELISQKQYANPQKDWSAIKRRLPQYAEFFTSLDAFIGPSLFKTNYGIILELKRRLGIGTEVIQDPVSNLKSTDRLVEICRIHGADTYLAGRSGVHYMELNKFSEAGIKVEFQDPAKIDQRHVFEILA